MYVFSLNNDNLLKIYYNFIAIFNNFTEEKEIDILLDEKKLYNFLKLCKRIIKEGIFLRVPKALVVLTNISPSFILVSTVISASARLGISMYSGISISMISLGNTVANAHSPLIDARYMNESSCFKFSCNQMFK